MASPFGSKTWELTVTDPEDGETWQVTLRTPTAIDRARFLDAYAMQTATGSRGPGIAQVQQVLDAIVEWTLPGDHTERETIENLREEIFNQIFTATENGPPTTASKTAPAEEPAEKKLEPAGISS